MELTDYLTAIRRQVRVWLGITVLGLLAAGVVLQSTPAIYRAKAQVFVSASQSIANSAQYIQTRVKSYPAIVSSSAVLDPVISQLGLKVTSADLAARVSATVPVDTSEVDVVVADPDPLRAARIANAVATQTAAAIQQLETPSSGNRLVKAIVTDPATPPTSPASPVAKNILGLGLVLGLFLGLAIAVVRSRFDRSVHDEADVRSSWGPAPLPAVLAPHRDRLARRSLLLGSPALELARKLELRAAEGRLDVALLSPAPGQEAAVRAFADELTAHLRTLGQSVGIGAPDGAGRPDAEGTAHVQLVLANPLASARSWRQLSATCDGAVLVMPRGRVHQAELLEMRTTLEAAGIPALAAVLTSPRSSGGKRTTRASAEKEPDAGARPVGRIAGIPGKGSVPARAGAERSTGASLTTRRTR